MRNLSIYMGEGVACLFNDNRIRANLRVAQYPPSSQGPRATFHISWSAENEDEGLIRVRMVMQPGEDFHDILSRGGDQKALRRNLSYDIM